MNSKDTVLLVDDDAERRHLADTILTKRAEEEQAAMEGRLRQSQRLQVVGQLAGGLAHEFNNIFQGLIHRCELGLWTPEISAELTEHLRSIARGVEKASGLSRHLLALAQNTVVYPRAVDLSDAVRGALVLLKPTLAEGVTVAMEVRPGAAVLLADPSELEQVLLNLFLNACEAMPGGGVLRVSAATAKGAEVAPGETKPRGEFILLTVEDSGEGMGPVALERAFEPLFTTKPGGPTRGLGLSTARAIVLQSGGSLRIESALGCGTRVTILWPAAAPGETSPGKPAAALVPRPAPLGLSILLAEDEPQVREALCLILKAMEHEIQAAASWDEARRLADSGPPVDLLITDMVMPGGSGLDLYRALCERQPGLKVLFVSGYSQDPDFLIREAGTEAGFLSKPFSRSALRAAIDRLFE